MKKRYNSAVGWYRERFGARVQKVAVNAGFTCPNRDGRVGTGGCTYCLNEAFNPSYCSVDKSVLQQIEEGIAFHAVRYRRAEKFIVYFQAFSNTYAPLEVLERVYGEALSHRKVVGLVVGTRPDCVDDAKLDYFAGLASRGVHVQIEYGVESCYDRTLAHVNRGHTFAQAREAIMQTSARGLLTGGHFIFGLPGESREEMLATAAIVSQLPLNAVKFHQLQVIKGTAMEAEYALAPDRFVRFGLRDYIDFFIDYLELLSPAIVVERFIGEVPPRYVRRTEWGLLRNVEILRMLEQRLEERDTWQGRKWSDIY
ncbi:MAG: TIGR01212 family radical SAM protein [Prevotellaceae bacterium]|nr:TIGR01212 family radical SAM protein [Prevotellaceae bacterium]